MTVPHAAPSVNIVRPVAAAISTAASTGEAALAAAIGERPTTMYANPVVSHGSADLVATPDRGCDVSSRT